MSEFECETEALADALPGLAAGATLTIHDAECPVWDDEPCECSPIIVHGPSAEA